MPMYSISLVCLPRVCIGLCSELQLQYVTRPGELVSARTLTNIRKCWSLKGSVPFRIKFYQMLSNNTLTQRVYTTIRLASRLLSLSPLPPHIKNTSKVQFCNKTTSASYLGEYLCFYCFCGNPATVHLIEFSICNPANFPLISHSILLTVYSILENRFEAFIMPENARASICETTAISTF